jgi:hypothetical protein
MTRTRSDVSLADWRPEDGAYRVDLFRGVTAELPDDLSHVTRRAWDATVRVQVEDRSEEVTVDLHLDKYGIAAIRAMLAEAEKALEAEPATFLDDPDLTETTWSTLTVTDLDQYGAPGDYLLPLVDSATVARDLYSALVAARATGSVAGVTVDQSTGTRYRGVFLGISDTRTVGMTTPVELQVEVRP